jgi:predicted permease
LHLPGGRVERDVDDEIAFHLASRVHALVEQGETEAAARRIAESEFGDLHASRRELSAVDRRRRRRERLAHAIESMLQDLHYAARSLRRSPAFATTTVATLGIGIGAAIAIFAVVNAVLLRPLPYADSDRLVGAWHDMPPISMVHAPQTATTFFTYRSQAHTIDGIGVYLERAVNVADRAGTAAPQRVTTALCSASLFAVLGVPPLRGRLIADDDDRPGAAPVMVISEEMWRARFGGDPHVVGRTVDVDGIGREIVGVMPRRFRFPSADDRIWIPLALDPANPPADAFNYPAVARLKRGVTIADARRDFAAVLPRVIELFPRFVPGITTRQIMDQVKPVPVLTPLRDDITGAIADTLWMIAAAASLLLLVAYVNAANLALVRVDARQRELAVREALGAGRARVVRYYFTESLVLALVAGLVGLLLAWGAVRTLQALGPAGLPRLAEIGIDATAVVFGVVVTGFAAAACGFIPAIRILQRGALLREGARGGTANRAQQRVRSTLVTAQVALCLVILAGSGLLLRSFEQLRALRPGFDPDHVVTLWISLPRARYATSDHVVRFFSTLLDEVVHLPHVEAVGLTSRVPLVDRGINQNPLYPEDQPQYQEKLPPLQIFTTIGGDYFRAMRIPLITGKLFDPIATQREGDAIISQRTAEFFWRDSTGQAALSKRFQALPNGPWYTVIGVVGNARDTILSAPASPTVYFPEMLQRINFTKQTTRTMALVVRTRRDPASVVPAVQREVRALDPTLPVFDVQSMSTALRASTQRLAFVILILAAATAVTMTLGGVGLYGVLAYIVTLRRRELGIRIALGASPRSVATATTRHGLGLTIAGVATGLVLFGFAARFMRSFLFGVAPWDPFAIVGAVSILLAMAACASWIPARRAGRVDPAEALRAD